MRGQTSLWFKVILRATDWKKRNGLPCSTSNKQPTETTRKKTNPTKELLGGGSALNTSTLEAGQEEAGRPLR